MDSWQNHQMGVPVFVHFDGELQVCDLRARGREAGFSGKADGQYNRGDGAVGNRLSRITIKPEPDLCVLTDFPGVKLLQLQSIVLRAKVLLKQ